MIGSTDDGRLCRVAFDFYQGLAGVRTVGIETHASFHGTTPGREAIDTIGVIEEREYRVVRAQPSQRNHRMVLLVIEPV